MDPTTAERDGNLKQVGPATAERGGKTGVKGVGKQVGPTTAEKGGETVMN